MGASPGWAQGSEGWIKEGGGRREGVYKLDLKQNVFVIYESKQ